MTTILHDSMEGSAITNVEIQLDESDYGTPAVSFTRDEGRDTVLITVGTEDDIKGLEVSGEVFWTALLLLSGDATDDEVEALTSGNSGE